MTQLGTLTNREKIIGEDFNMVEEMDLDRSVPLLLGAQAHRTAKGFEDWIKNWGLTDTWRTQHGHERDYSFFSSLYSLHVRLNKIP